MKKSIQKMNEQELRAAAQEKKVLKNGKSIFTDRAIAAQTRLYEESFSSCSRGYYAPTREDSTIRLSDEW